MKDIYLAIGNFDGIHKGHKHILNETVKAANAGNGIPAVLTFYPHPLTVLGIVDKPILIYPIAQRYWILHKIGLKLIFIKNFTLQFAKWSPLKFFIWLTEIFKNLKSIHVGEDFSFGNKGLGKIDTLMKFSKCSNIKLNAYKILYKNVRISSSMIRDMLKAGTIKNINELLGVNYECIGKVVDNTFYHHYKLLPKDGCYGCELVSKFYHRDTTIVIKNNQIFFKENEIYKFNGSNALLRFKKSF